MKYIVADTNRDKFLSCYASTQLDNKSAATILLSDIENKTVLSIQLQWKDASDFANALIEIAQEVEHFTGIYETRQQEKKNK